MSGNAELRCARPGCADRYRQHAPGGGACMWWDPITERHCECWGFQWVALGAELSPRRQAGPLR